MAFYVYKNFCYEALYQYESSFCFNVSLVCRVCSSVSNRSAFSCASSSDAASIIAQMVSPVVCSKNVSFFGVSLNCCGNRYQLFIIEQCPVFCHNNCFV